MKRHFDSSNGNLKNLAEQALQDKINVIKREMKAQQTTLQSYCKTDNDIIRTSYEISKVVAKKLKPNVEGEYVKECIVTDAKTSFLSL